MNTTDGELLRRYTSEHSEEAFQELVQRHIDLVYSAALRQVNGDSHLAEDVTQTVFTDLAAKAAKLNAHTSLTGWLYTSTRFATSMARRTENRRRAREQEAHAMNSILDLAEPERDWSQIRPLLDEAMHALDEKDREAVLLRHFERRSYAEIGTRFGLNENAARMRVERALEKLHATLAKRGLTSTALALGVLLTTNALASAPPHLAIKISRTALAATAATGGAGLALSKLFALSQVKAVAAVVAIAATAAVVLISRHTTAKTPQTASSPAVATPTKITAAEPALSNKQPAEVSETAFPSLIPPGSSVVKLFIVAKDGNRPLAFVPIEYRAWTGEKFQGQKQFTSSRLGICEVSYPTNTTEMELTTRLDGFADTRLTWNPANGEMVPTNYVLRLERAVPIGGRVVDPDGNPVAGAKVGWNHEENPGGPHPESHDFAWIETTTDQDGRWQINRIAEDMLRRLYGAARDTNYVDSPPIFSSRDSAVEKELRDGTHIFHLGRGVIAHGVIVDANNQPVSDAKVFVGHPSSSAFRQARTASDGSFSIIGCPPGKQLVTAEARGFASTTIETELADDASSIQLTLQPGNNLRLRLVDKNGNPIKKANVWYDSINRGPINSNKPQPVQAEVELRTDSEGRTTWTNAPAGNLTFSFNATGFTRLDDIEVTSDDQEHVITMSRALVVAGEVRDASTGELIPHFRIAEGYPQWNPMDGTTNPTWSSIERFWHDFGNGTYRQSFEEAVIGGTKNPGYFLKFMADGYAPFVSRVIGPDEGEIKLDVSLTPAKATIVTVYQSNGQPAGGADIGLVSPGARLSLAQGGFARDNVQTGGSLLTTDVSGKFTLPSDNSITKVIAANADGYAEATPTELTNQPAMRLQPWGGLEVSCVSGDKPIAGREFLLQMGGGSDQSVSFRFDLAHYTTDAQGQFSIAKLPPGTHNLVRLIPQPASGNTHSWMHGNKTEFEIKSGETTKLVLGASSHTVTARFQWPAGVQSQPDWFIHGIVWSPITGLTPEIMGNPAARSAFFETPEFKTASKNRQSYNASLNADGTFSADEVPPGNYEFWAIVNSNPGNSPRTNNAPQFVAVGKIDFTVPTNPSSDTIDAGTIQLQSALQ